MYGKTKLIISLAFPGASLKVLPHLAFFQHLASFVSFWIIFIHNLYQQMNYTSWICRNYIKENRFIQVTSMNKVLIYTLCLKFCCIHLDYFLVFRVLAFKILILLFICKSKDGMTKSTEIKHCTCNLNYY